MKLTPWKRRHDSVENHDGASDFLTRAFEGLREHEWPFANRLPSFFSGQPMAPLNIAEDESGFDISVELPGLKEEDIKVELMGNQLLVSGERRWGETSEGKEFHRVESQYGSFQRSVSLPPGLRLDRDSIEAKFKRGILRIRVPKVEPTPAIKIEVEKD